MNLLVLSRNYPNCSSHNGIFVEEQVKALRPLIGDRLTVISPVPWSPRILWFNKKWREYGKIEKERFQDGIKVFYPRFLVVPGRWFFMTFVDVFYLSFDQGAGKEIDQIG